MGIPQIIIICLMALTTGINLSEAANGKTEIRQFVVSLLGTLTWAVLLWWGGFWD